MGPGNPGNIFRGCRAWWPMISSTTRVMATMPTSICWGSMRAARRSISGICATTSPIRGRWYRTCRAPM